MSFAKVNGITLHYEIQGAGPKLLFIHGIGADMKNQFSIWNTPLAGKFTILAFDPRGLGESEKTDKSFSMKDLADDAAGLAAAAGWTRYSVFGASMGGMVAQELAIRYPESVEKLVLGVTNPGGKYAAPQVLGKLASMTTLEKLRLSYTRQDTAWAAEHPEMVLAAEERFAKMQREWADDPEKLRGFLRQAEAVQKHDTFDRLQHITAPALVFRGRYDGSNP